MPWTIGAELGDILGIWGHPDDEAWLTAGLMMDAVLAGRRVTCVTATKGEAGFPADDPRSEAERMAVRSAELAASLAALGVTDHRWLGYRDGHCADEADAEVAARLASIIDEVRPDTVLTFGPDGGTGHPDHIAACRWTTQAVRLCGDSGIRLLYAAKTPWWREMFLEMLDPSSVMMTDEGELPVTEDAQLAAWFACDDELLSRKVTAMRAQASQLEPMFQQLGPAKFATLVRDEFFREPSSADPF